MATRTTTVLVDDLDGTEASKTIAFSFDGTNYSIDLNDDNAKSLRDALKPYTKVATIVTARRSSGGGSKSNKDELAAIRDWAGKNGHEVSPRGRIPQSIADEYHASK